MTPANWIRPSRRTALILATVGLFHAGIAAAQSPVPTTSLPTAEWQAVFAGIGAARDLTFTDPKEGLRLADEIVAGLTRRGAATDGMMAHALSLRSEMRLRLAPLERSQIALALRDIDAGIAIARQSPTEDLRWAGTSMLMKKARAVYLASGVEDPADAYAEQVRIYREALALAPSAAGLFADTRWNVYTGLAGAACTAFDLETCRTTLQTMAGEAPLAQLEPRIQFNFYLWRAWVGAYGGEWDAAADALTALARVLTPCREAIEAPTLAGLQTVSLVLIQSGATELGRGLAASVSHCLRMRGPAPTDPNLTLVAGTAQAWSVLADLYINHGDHESAAVALEQATRYMDGMSPRLRQLAETHLRDATPERRLQAMPEVAAALGIYWRVGAELSIRAGDQAQALKFLANVASSSCAYDSALLGRVHAQRGERTLALRALDIGYAKLGVDRVCDYAEWRYYIEAARVLALLDDLTGAIALGKEAIALSETTRRGFDARRQRAFVSQLVTSRAGIYRDTAAWLIESGRHDEAHAVLALLRDREVEELSRGVLEAVIEGIEALLRPDERTSRRLREQGGSRALTRSLAALDRTAGAASQPMIPPTHAVRRVPTGDVLITAIPTSGATVVLQVRDARGVMPCGGVLPASRLNADALLLGSDLTNRAPRQSWLPYATALHRTIWAPIDACVAARLAPSGTVHLDLHGALRTIPFAVLFDGTQHLVERYTFAITAEGTAASSAAGARRRILASFGADTTTDGRNALQYAREEAIRVADSVEPASAARLFVDRAFSRVQLLETLEDTDIARVHVATHFVLPSSGLPSGHLVLGDGTRLYTGELARLRLDGLELLVLSACDTARVSHRGGAMAGDVDSLAAMLRRQGAGSIVASLWRVNDRSAIELMTRFHERLAGPGRQASVAVALRAAQLALLSNSATEHPHYWASFVAIGRVSE